MNKFLFLIPVIFILSCNSEEKRLISFYHQIDKAISDGKASEIYNLMDKQSVDYVDFVINSKNQDYDKLYAFGDSVGYPFFTTLCYFKLGEKMKKEKDNLEFYITFLRFNDIPLFSSFGETTLIENKTEAGNENYLTVALEIGKDENNSKVYYYTKIKVVKEENNYKFNLLGMLNFNEKKLIQQYEKYRTYFGLEKIPGSEKSFIKKENVEYPDDMFKSFFENIGNPGNELDEFHYYEK